MNTYYVIMNVHNEVCYIHKDVAKCNQFKGTTQQVRSYTAPDEWEMFSKRGDQSIAKKAETFLERLTTPSYPAAKAARLFLRSYVRLRNSRTMSEAGDTAVRESVWHFVSRFKNLIGDEALETIWEEEVH